MSYHNHHGAGLGAFAIVAAIIAFVFGKRTAQIVVGSVLIVGVLFFAYVMFRIVVGTL